VISTSTEIFSFVEDRVLFAISYNECELAETLTCDFALYNEKSQMYNPLDDCIPFFQDYETWSHMRKEPVLLTHSDWQAIYKYFEIYHGFDQDEDETKPCEHKQIQTECEDFNMFLDQECNIYIEYDTCDVKSFTCKSTDFDVNLNQYQPVEDCSSQPFDFEFWSQIRREPVFDLYPQWKGLHRLFDEYHSINN